MQQMHRVAAGLAVVVAAGFVPGAPAAVGSETGERHRAAASCVDEGGNAAVRNPKLVRNIDTGETGWFSSPGLVDLDGDGRLEIVAPFYSTFVFDATGPPARQGAGEQGPGLRRRRWSPTSRATASPTSWSAGNEGTVAAYELRGGGLHLKDGWPASTTSGGQSPGGTRARGRRPRRRRPGRGGGHDHEHLADRRPGLRLRRERAAVPAVGRPLPAWPRYNRLAGPGNDRASTGSATTATARTARTSASATSTTTPSSRSSPPSTTTRSTPSTSTAPRSSPRPGSPTASPTREGRRMGWGQFIRWADPGSSGATTTATPARGRARRDEAWLQWTASPPVGGRPRRRRPQRGDRHPQRRDATSPTAPRATRSWCSTARTATAARSARRHPGFETLPMSNRPVHRPDGDWYPPSGIPAPTVVDILGDAPARDRRGAARRQGLRGRPGRPAALDHHLRAAAREDLRLRGGRGRPQPGRHARAGLRHLRAASATPDAWSCCRAHGKGLSVDAAAPPGPGRQRHRRAGRALDRRPRPATARSRSSSPPSTTASTSTRCRARAPAACRGRPGAGTCSATGWAPATAP